MSEIIIYQTPDNQTQVEVKFEEDTVWLTQAQMVELFMLSKANISEHLKNIFNSGELDTVSTVRKFRTVRQEGKRKVSRDFEHYNLDVIISLGYRVNSQTGIKFRQWASQRLKDYLVQGHDHSQLSESRITRIEGLLGLKKTKNKICEIGVIRRIRDSDNGIFEKQNRFFRHSNY